MRGGNVCVNTAEDRSLSSPLSHIGGIIESEPDLKEIMHDLIKKIEVKGRERTDESQSVAIFAMIIHFVLLIISRKVLHMAIAVFTMLKYQR